MHPLVRHETDQTFNVQPFEIATPGVFLLPMYDLCTCACIINLHLCGDRLCFVHLPDFLLYLWNVSHVDGACASFTTDCTTNAPWLFLQCDDSMQVSESTRNGPFSQSSPQLRQTQNRPFIFFFSFRSQRPPKGSRWWVKQQPETARVLWNNTRAGQLPPTTLALVLLGGVSVSVYNSLGVVLPLYVSY